jgi:hypothetical protein
LLPAEIGRTVDVGAAQSLSTVQATPRHRQHQHHFPARILAASIDLGLSPLASRDHSYKIASTDDPAFGIRGALAWVPSHTRRVGCVEIPPALARQA